MVDALGNPLAFLLTPGQAHDLDGADVLLPQMQADTLLADKAFDADKRVIEPLLSAGKTPVIPSMPGRKSPRPYDRDCGFRRRRTVVPIEGGHWFRSIADTIPMIADRRSR